MMPGSSLLLSSRIPLLFLLFAVGGVHSFLVRRALHSSTVAGNYIYVDGGQFSQIVNEDTYLLSIETHTLSIPLDTSWSPATVEINIINKTEGAPLLNGAKIWTSPAAEGFYSYGGEISPMWQGSVQPRGLWNFNADGEGAGIWADQTSTAGVIFNELVSTADGASDVLGNTAYYLGGVSSNTSNPNQAGVGDNQTAISGLVSFDMNTGLWGNDTAGGYAGTGKTINSAMVHVPRFGTDGLLLVMGGTSSGANPSVTDEGNTPYLSFGDISLFDPAANSWYSQTATGTIPEDRERFCLVGVEAADNMSYEIFMYGGASITPSDNAIWITSDSQLDEVFVLSLPKFEWVKANYTATQNRHSHTCQVAGNRQMISIGGIDGSTPDIDGYNITDPFPETIGIFDLTQMTWVENFTHDAPPYQRPAAVETLYSDNNPFPSTWSSPAVEKLFTNNETAPISPTHTTSTALRTGVIIGAIFCSLALIALITALLLLWRRRKQTLHKKPLDSRSSHRSSMMHDHLSRPIPIARVYSYSLDNESLRSGNNVSLRSGNNESMRSGSGTTLDWEPIETQRSICPWEFEEPRTSLWSLDEMGDGLPRAIG